MSTVEQYGNFGSSTCTGTIDNTTNPFTIVVASGAGANFPATTNGPFRIVVSNSDGSNAEPMIVTARATDTMTAQRGANIKTYGADESPAAALSTHSAGSVVAHVLTAGAMSELLLERKPLYTPPTGLTLSDGIGGAVLSTDLYGLTLTAPSAAGNNVIYCSTALGTSTYTAIFGFRGIMANANFSQCGPIITDGTKMIVWRHAQSQGSNDIYYFSNFSTPVTQFATTPLQQWGQDGVFVKIVQDATHRTFYYMDSRLRSAGIQAFQQTALTSLTENAVGFWILTDNGTSALVEGLHLTVTH